MRAELLGVQRDLVESRIAILIIVAGVESAGKGEVVDRLNKWFDNRGKWDDYRRAVNNMVVHTSTGNCPWTLVSANDKYNARIEVLRTVRDKLKQALD